MQLTAISIPSAFYLIKNQSQERKKEREKERERGGENKKREKN